MQSLYDKEHAERQYEGSRNCWARHAAVLPKYDQFWFRISHLLQLNLILLVPLMSSAVARDDGMRLVINSNYWHRAPLCNC